MEQEEQKFLNDLDKKLWNAAGKLRSNIADIRDSQLPKLLSGEITLGDTQSTAEAVA